MDIEEIKAAAAGAPLKETFAFKMSGEQKEEFVEACRAYELSTGGVIRALIQKFLEELR